ncbi:oligosaccharide flippase family protein [Salipiger abyssi]|uniref:Membrane protein involved in the export of O-antigen and teichoic acid n=1 Tax=Salipiger abyssi TaxID=1250539 RepID=A0A1P8UU32_9RHOB|nr:oligosaccharide flippase family protein [Salipiger abyssi]APZ52882.1 membrane protein involved in the export of O-antigen and teichoic acid [Salipiger abyssi]
MADTQNDQAIGNRWKGRRKRGAFAIFAFLSRSLQQISTFVITLMAARFLLPAEYGVYSLGIVFVTLIQTMTYTGFYHFIVTSKEDDQTVLSTSFWLLTGLATGAALLMIAAAYPISWLFDAPELGPVLVLLSALQPIAGITAWYSAVLLRRQKVQLHFTVMFLQNALALAGGVLLLWLWQSLYALVAFRAVRVLSAIMLYLLFAGDRPSLRFDRNLARKATNFSGGLYGSRFINFLQQYSGDLLLGFMFSTAEAGLYRFGNRVAKGAIDVVGQPIQSFSLTQFGAANRNDKPLGPLVERFVGTLVLLTGGVAAVIVVFAETVVGSYFNSAYLAGLGVTYAMAIRGVMNVGLLLLTPALSARSRTGLLMFFNMGSAGAIILAVFAASPFGLSALAWAQTAVTALATGAALIVMKRKAGIEIRGALRALTVSLVIVIAYGLALWLIWSWITGPLALAGIGALILGLGIATLLAGVVLVAGWKLKVFTLQVFSG